MGLCFGLSVLTRPSALLLLPFLLVVAWIVSRRRGGVTLRWLVAVGVCGLVMAPWIGRNYRLTGHLVLTTLKTGGSLYEANSPEADGGPKFEIVSRCPGLEGKSEYGRDRHLRATAMRWIRDHPGKFLQLALIKFRRFWNLVPNYSPYRRLPYALISLFSYGPVLILSLAGILLSRRRWRTAWVLLAPAIYFAAVHSVFVGSIRYRAPVMPLLIVLAGYAVHRLWARLLGENEQRPALGLSAIESPKLSVIVPALNEERTIEELLGRVLAVPMEKEIIVVDDGSTDRTGEIAERLASAHPEIQVRRHPHTQGKGAAIQTARDVIRGDVVIIQDADLEYDPQEYPTLVEPIRNGSAAVVYGSRIRGSKAVSYRRYYWGGRLVSAIANLMYNTRITDEPTCYKVFRADLFHRLRLRRKGFGFCAEVTAQLGRNRVPIREVPISYAPRSISEGKKIRWTDGAAACGILFWGRFARGRKLL